MMAFSFIDHRFLLRSATSVTSQKGGEIAPPNHKSHSQVHRPSSRQMRNWVERGNNVDKINGQGKDYIVDNKNLIQTTARTRHIATSPRTCAPWETSPRDCCCWSWVDYIRWEDVARGLSIKRRFILSYTHIYTFYGGPGDA